MTQQLVETARPAEDSLKTMLGQLEADRARLRKAPPESVPALTREIVDTVLEYQKDVLLELIGQRDWANGAVSDLDERVGDLENGEGGSGTQLLPEDAEKFKALAMGVDHLITMMSSIPAVGADSNVMSAFEKLRALAKECLGIVEETTLIDPPEGEEEDDEDEEDASGRPG